MRTILIALCLILTAGAADVTVVRDYPITDTEGVIDRDGVEFNKTLTTDRNGSLALKADDATTFRLYETGDLDLEETLIIYQAKMKTLNVKGDAYLEMWCRFPGRGEYFSRGLQYALSGTQDWVSVETPFVLRKGENPDNIRLNVVVTGKGRVWLDEVRIVKSELPAGN